MWRFYLIIYLIIPFLASKLTGGKNSVPFQQIDG